MFIAVRVGATTGYVNGGTGVSLGSQFAARRLAKRLPAYGGYRLEAVGTTALAPTVQISQGNGCGLTAELAFWKREAGLYVARGDRLNLVSRLNEVLGGMGRLSVNLGDRYLWAPVDSQAFCGKYILEADQEDGGLVRKLGFGNQIFIALVGRLLGSEAKRLVPVDQSSNSNNGNQLMIRFEFMRQKYIFSITLARAVLTPIGGGARIDQSLLQTFSGFFGQFSLAENGNSYVTGLDWLELDGKMARLLG